MAHGQFLDKLSNNQSDRNCEPWWGQRHGRRLESNYMIMVKAEPHNEAIMAALFRRTSELA